MTQFQNLVHLLNKLPPYETEEYVFISLYQNNDSYFLLFVFKWRWLFEKSWNDTLNWKRCEKQKIDRKNRSSLFHDCNRQPQQRLSISFWVIRIKHEDMGENTSRCVYLEFRLIFKREKVNNSELIFAINRRRILDNMNTLPNQRINFVALCS